jgi:hypothetical protein
MAGDGEVDLGGGAAEVTPSDTKSNSSREDCLVELRVSATRRDVHGDNVGRGKFGVHCRALPVVSYPE